MPATKIRTQVKYQKISNDDGYIDAQVCENYDGITSESATIHNADFLLCLI